MSRTVHGERWLAIKEQGVLRRLLERVAEFSGLRVLTYCLMNNHFHLLVEVPAEAAREALSDAELARRFRVLYGSDQPKRSGQLTADEVDAIFEEGGAVAAALRERLLQRMHNLPVFMETLKNRFTRWYNDRYETYGTLWAGRYKSVIVEGDAAMLKNVAAYIDLNPVRAGLVKDPAEYPYSGFGEASRGQNAAREALEALCSYGTPTSPRKNAFNHYAALVYARGSVGAGSGKGGFIPPEIVQKKLKILVTKIDPGGFDPSFMKTVCRSFIMGSAAFLSEHAPTLAKSIGRKRKPKIRTVALAADEANETAFWNQVL